MAELTAAIVRPAATADAEAVCAIYNAAIAERFDVRDRTAPSR